MQNSPSISGAKYLAVVMTPRRTLPARRPLRSANLDSRSPRARKMVRHAWYSSCPASVARVRRPTGSSSVRPTESASFFICRLTVGWVRNSSSAALVKLPRRTMASNTWSWRSVACRIRNSELLCAGSAMLPPPLPPAVLGAICALGSPLIEIAPRFSIGRRSVGPAQPASRVGVAAPFVGRARPGGSAVLAEGGLERLLPGVGTGALALAHTLDELVLLAVLVGLAVFCHGVNTSVITDSISSTADTPRLPLAKSGGAGGGKGEVGDRRDEETGEGRE